MSDENILEYFEKEKCIKLPQYLKNLLIFTGFDNKLSLSKLEPADIQDLENIGRDTLPHIITSEMLPIYLGPFSTHPQSFVIFPGHKKLLQELAQFYKNFSYKRRSLNPEEPHASKKTATDSPITDQGSSQPKPNRPRDVDSERQNIYTLLTNWLTNFCSRYLTFEEAAHVNKELPKLKIGLIEEEANQCFVTCCICLRELKIFRNQNGFWIMSNIHKHFKTHLSSYSNKKFSKNISISSSISNSLNHENETAIFLENDVKHEHEYLDESN